MFTGPRHFIGPQQPRTRLAVVPRPAPPATGNPGAAAADASIRTIATGNVGSPSPPPHPLRPDALAPLRLHGLLHGLRRAGTGASCPPPLCACPPPLPRPVSVLLNPPLHTTLEFNPFFLTQRLHSCSPSSTCRAWLAKASRHGPEVCDFGHKKRSEKRSWMLSKSHRLVF